MDTRLLRLFQAQINDQIYAYRLAAADIDRGMVMLREGTDPPSIRRAHDQFWYGVQGALIAAANVSKLLWGQGGKLAAERAPLRESLEVDDSSPLRTTRMRNHWEHMDERLDLWHQKSTRHNYIDRMVGPPEVIVGVDTIDMFRWFDPATENVIFWGDRFDLRAITNEVRRLHPIAERVIKSHRGT